MIEIKNLTKTFHTRVRDIVALENINLQIEDGEIFGIIGLSGAGKSTLVRCMNLLERPSEGNIIFDGEDLTLLSKKELLLRRRKISMIFQGFNLLEQRNVLDNVCFPMEIAKVPRAEAVERAKKLLETVGLSDRLKSYPSQLSGGQKQRVAIARALSTDPKVILCDEATSALDPNTTRSILALLQEINKNLGVTIVVITHEMKVIEQICDRVAVIDQSHIVECGRVDAVFANPQSEISRNLILPDGKSVKELNTERCIRIIFDGNSAYEPVLSNLILENRIIVNVLFADTKEIGGKAYGQMLLQLPDDERTANKIYAYLDGHGIAYKKEGV